MPVETDTDVEEIRNVQNEEGDRVSPATEQQQMTIAGANAETVVAGGVNIGTETGSLPDVEVPLGVTAAIVVEAPDGEAVYFGTGDVQPLRRRDGEGIETHTNLSEWTVRGTHADCGVAYVVETTADGGDA